MNAPDAPSPVGRRPFTPYVENRLDQEAQRLSGGDAALYFHHLTLPIGERRIRSQGAEYWNSYLRTKQLSQYRAVEQSVIQGWRKLVEKMTGIAPDKQSDIHAVHRAATLIALRWCIATGRLAEFFKRKSQTLHAAVDRQEVDFFRAMGRLLSPTGQKNGQSTYFRQFDYSYQMLARWLTDYYWLMPAKLASERLSLALAVQDNLKRFLSTKARYGLNSHRPTLVFGFEKVSPGIETIVLTPDGEHLLGPKRKRLSR